MNYKKIREIGKVVSGSTPKSNQKEYWGGNIPWITPKELGNLSSPFISRTERTLTQEGYSSCSTTMIPANSILFTSRAPIGHIAVNSVEMCTNQGFKSIVLDEKQGYYLYIYYCLKSLTDELKDMGTGSTFKELSKSRFEEYEIPLPPLQEQIKIASILKKVEDLIQKRKESVELLDKLVKSTFMEMFGDLFDSDAEELRKHIKIQQGYAFKSGDFSEDGIPVIKIGTVNKGYFDFKSISFLPDEKYDEKYISRPGDLLMSLTGTAGKEDYGNTCIVPDKYEFYLLNQRVGSIVPLHDDVNKVFLHFLFQQRKVKSEIIKYSRGVRQANISNEDILKIKVKMPSKVRQDEFLKFWKQSDISKKNLQQSEKEIKKLYTSLSQLAFEGHLDLSKLNVDHLLPKTEDKTGPRIMAKADPNKEYKTMSNEELEKILNVRKVVSTPQEALEFIRKGKREAIQKEVAGLENKGIIDRSKKTGPIFKSISYSDIVNWIRTIFKDNHFSTEMLLRLCEEEKGVFVHYFTSKEWKENLATDELLDIKSIVFSALEEAVNPKGNEDILQLEQLFYDGEKQNFDLKLRERDFDFIFNRTPKERSGIYFKVKA